MNPSNHPDSDFSIPQESFDWQDEHAHGVIDHNDSTGRYERRKRQAHVKTNDPFLHARFITKIPSYRHGITRSEILR